MTDSLFSRFDRWRRRNGLVFEGLRWPPVLYEVVAWYGGLSDARAGLFHVTALLFAAATAFYLFGAASLFAGERGGGTTPAIAFPAFEATQTPDLPTETALPTLPPRPTVTLPPPVIEAPIPPRAPAPRIFPTEALPLLPTETPVPATVPAGTPPTIAVVTVTRPASPTVPAQATTPVQPTSTPGVQATSGFAPPPATPARVQTLPPTAPVIAGAAAVR